MHDARSGFEDMAPLFGREAEDALWALLDARDWVSDLSRLVDPGAAAQIVDGWRSTEGPFSFQSDVVKPFLDALMAQTTEGVTMEVHPNAMASGMLFLSNHRDIVLDPSLVNMALLDRGRTSTEIGIGSNLLGSEWVRNLVRLNRCFVVKREGSARDRFNSSVRTAAYIRNVIHNDTPVWLAHREGRAKDGVDATAPALIRTLSDGCSPDIWNRLKVVPVSISYEWDPCDALKVNELLHRAKNGTYEKAPGEDEQSMLMGLAGQKGRVHVAMADCMPWMGPEDGERPERFMAERFDRCLLQNMKPWPNQHLAAQHLGLDNETVALAPKPTEEETRSWNLRLQAIQKFLEPQGWSHEEVATQWCEMLAAPLSHKLSLLTEMGHGDGPSH